MTLRWLLQQGVPAVSLGLLRRVHAPSQLVLDEHQSQAPGPGLVRLGIHLAPNHSATITRHPFPKPLPLHLHPSQLYEW